MRKLDRILIIDDDEVNNFVCKQIIKKSGIQADVDTKSSADKGLDLLKEAIESGKNEFPDLIFLDINMPVMNGWDFLEEYKKLLPQINKDIVLMMLSSSVYEHDIEKSKAYHEVSDYIFKPLKTDKIKEICSKYFAS